jgi:hypothetical protein
LSGKQIPSLETAHLVACSSPRVIATILRLAAFVRCAKNAAFSFLYAFSHTTSLSLRPLLKRRSKSNPPFARRTKQQR